jgi:N-methylhydantoinase A
MVARARRELGTEGARAGDIRNELFADVRYRGQSYEIEVALTPRFAADFHDAHRRVFGHSAPDAPIEVVNLRLRASAPGIAAAPARMARSSGNPKPMSQGRVLVGERTRTVPIYARDALGAGARIRGPAIVVELSATAYVAPEFTLRVDGFGNLHLEAAR